MIDHEYAQFVAKWCHPDYLPARINPEKLDAIEAQFGIQFPVSYRDCMEKVGPASPTLDLLSSVADQRLELRPVQEFLGPSSIVNATYDWQKGGLSKSFVAFATHCSGDLFCFKRAKTVSGRPQDSIVWYFDHDVGTTKSTRLAFSKWLRAHFDIKQTVNEFRSSN